ncbi:MULTISPECIES: hypothetical protein [Paenibacillus]|uniref:hypothetical protein n=1 Tax=Paenibacillus TaxID=44249 RepID=UPI00117D7424|nr:MULTISPECIES: hypothetical protein [Paenibacillus]
MNKKDKVYLANFLFPDKPAGKEISDLMQMAASADRICRLKYCEGDQVQDICLQVHKDITLIAGIEPSDSFVYRLSDPQKVQRACYYLFNCFEPEEFSVEDVPCLHLSRRRYEELKESAATYSLCFLAECLTAETGDLLQSAQLAKVMKNKTAEGELKLCSRSKEECKLQHAFFIEDTSSGWLLRMSCEAAEDWMVAIPVTKAQICSALYEWVQQTSPVFTPE